MLTAGDKSTLVLPKNVQSVWLLCRRIVKVSWCVVGPEEEKVLGSILLPSYIISPCSSEERVYRKYAFKAEHRNTRTYYFAAETKESMIQWMNALSLATILHENVG